MKKALILAARLTTVAVTLALSGCGSMAPDEATHEVDQPLKSAGGGADAVYSPWVIENEKLSKRWPGSDPSCFAVDDQYSWRATGSLRPGESYTYYALPTCDYAEFPVVAVTARWDASQLEVTSVAPSGDGFSGDSSQVGTPVVAASHGNEAHLCMFTSAYGVGEGFTYAITVRNTGTETAYKVELDGKQTNGWPIYFHNACSRADADRDGWNDSLERGMQMLTYRRSRTSSRPRQLISAIAAPSRSSRRTTPPPGRCSMALSSSWSRMNRPSEPHRASRTTNRSEPARPLTANAAS